MPTGSTTKKTAAAKASAKKVAASNGAGQTELAKILADPIQRVEAQNALELRDMMETLISKRKSLGLSQRDIAEKIGISAPVVSQAELGNTALSVSALQRYARAVGGRVALHITH